MATLLNRQQFIIEWGHCDPAGLLFESRAFEFFDRGTWGLFELALGVTPVRFSATFGVAGIPLVDARARFLSPARFGDAVVLTTAFSDVRRSSFDVKHRLFVGDTLAIEGLETRVWATRDAIDPSKIKALPIPPEVMARLRTP